MRTHPRHHAAEAPDRPALIVADTGQILTYGQLADRSARAAALLLARGLIEGDTVAILVENSVRYPELLWAAKDSGIRYVCISTHLDVGDAAYIVADSGARLLIASATTRALASAALKRLDAPPPLLVVDGPASDVDSYEESLPPPASVKPPTGRKRGPSMLYSSGTTGRPKGVRTPLPDVSPETPPQRFAMLQRQYGLSPDTVFLNPGPLYHSAPNRFMMSVLRAGGTVVVLARFDAAATLDAFERHRATHGFFVPTMFARMLALPTATREARDISSMQFAIHAAAPCPVEVKRAMIEWWGPVIEELYAGTEAFGHTFISSDEWLRHPGSVGRPAAGCNLKIVGEDGRRLATGEIGRIMMSNGLRVVYHGDEEKTAGLYDDEGYASLGDLGYLDPEGYLYLTDRESHMIIAGGVNIYPQEAEAVLGRHPAVADVAVIGIPDRDMGEAVHAVVELAAEIAPGEALANDLIAFCRRNLSAYKCPRTIDFVDTLPRNEMGKLLKRKVREKFWSGENRLI